MAPPQVNLNEKPPAEPSQGDGGSATEKKEALLSALTDRYNDLAHDPLPEKKDSEGSTPVIVTVERTRARYQLTVEQRRQRKRCRIACCASLTMILVLLLALGTACLVYRMKHRKGWRSFCGTKEGNRVPEHVKVDHDNQLIYVKPDLHTNQVMEVLHEYNRHLIAFKNTTSNTCYIDRLDETFADGYARWQGYEETEHKQGRTLRVISNKIQIEVVKHIADVHIVEHCGGQRIEYYWVMEVTQAEIQEQPDDTYITV